MRVCVASSWRNPAQEWVVRELRKLGYQVYDFRGPGDGWGMGGEGPGGFAWSDIDVSYLKWVEDVDAYIAALTHPIAVRAYLRDMNALRCSHAVVMVNPCGQSAYAEMGWACGAGKPVAVYSPAIREPDLMVKMADLITSEWSIVSLWLQRIQHKKERDKK